jgi:hypothetical protein
MVLMRMWRKQQRTRKMRMRLDDTAFMCCWRPVKASETSGTDKPCITRNKLHQTMPFDAFYVKIG